LFSIIPDSIKLYIEIGEERIDDKEISEAFEAKMAHAKQCAEHLAGASAEIQKMLKSRSPTRSRTSQKRIFSEASNGDVPTAKKANNADDDDDDEDEEEEEDDEESDYTEESAAAAPQPAGISSKRSGKKAIVHEKKKINGSLKKAPAAKVLSGEDLDISDPKALVNQSVAKYFGKTLYHGFVKEYRPADCVWHVLYEDGDTEDYELHELLELFELRRKYVAGEAG